MRDARESAFDIRELDAVQVLQGLSDLQAQPVRWVLLCYGQERNDGGKEGMRVPALPDLLTVQSRTRLLLHTRCRRLGWHLEFSHIKKRGYKKTIP